MERTDGFIPLLTRPS
jgi:hypothetical protein